MTKARWMGLLLVLFSSGISVWWGCSLGRTQYGGPFDFRAVYYGTRTLLQQQNPYSARDVEVVCRTGGEENSSLTLRQRCRDVWFINTPGTLLLIAPFAALPLGPSQVLWTILMAACLTVAAFLVWDFGADIAPVLSGCLVGFLVANCQILFGGGNSAGIVVSLCVVAAWCFIMDRFAVGGILCMAVSLVIKPHDTGLVWLYFLLAGGVYRKRALQTASLAALLTLPAVLWVSHSAPDWMQHWQSNLDSTTAPGGLNDPRPASLPDLRTGNIISLQAVFSIFRDNPQFYNWASYLVCGVPLLLWAVTTMRSRTSPYHAWLALAAIVPFTVLVTYHRGYDAKLLLLTIPACVILWSKGGPLGWTALVLNAAGIVLNADLPQVMLGALIRGMHLSTATLSGQILTVVLARPNQEILLVMGAFYLWVYMRRPLVIGASSPTENAAGTETDLSTFDLDPFQARSMLGGN
jgi:hypothetical protein